MREAREPCPPEIGLANNRDIESHIRCNRVPPLQNIGLDIHPMAVYVIQGIDRSDDQVKLMTGPRIMFQPIVKFAQTKTNPGGTCSNIGSR